MSVVAIGAAFPFTLPAVCFFSVLLVVWGLAGRDNSIGGWGTSLLLAFAILAVLVLIGFAILALLFSPKGLDLF